MASSITSVGDGVKNIADKYNKDKKFPGGKTIAYGLDDHGVYLTKSELTKSQKAAKLKRQKSQLSMVKLQYQIILRVHNLTKTFKY